LYPSPTGVLSLSKDADLLEGKGLTPCEYSS
jgi:hypothetical protein